MKRSFGRVGVALTLLALGLAFSLFDAPVIKAQTPAFTGVCANGAQAREAKYCSFFVHYNTDANSTLDVRIADALDVSAASQTRSIALVIAIDTYPNIKDGDLPAAKVDGDRLISFLVDAQKFDEVILLRNADATVDNINYFLEEYLPNRGDEFNKKGRLLIAYSGHGRYGSADSNQGPQAAFILSAASDANGSQNVYKMQSFATDVEAVASHYFHVLTLVNACYGGGFFKDGTPGGNPDAYRKRGSYAITAGNSDEVVPSLDPTRGSLFFDTLINGVQLGAADPQAWRLYAVTDGVTERSSGVTRTNALLTYLTTSYEIVARQRRRKQPTFNLSEPWIGPAQFGVASGGFFFLSNQAPTPNQAGQSAANDDLARLGYSRGAPFGESLRETVSFNEPPEAVPLGRAAAHLTPVEIPPGPVSSIAGHPNIKIFKPPEVYPVQGFDLSSADGKIDWSAFYNQQHPRFIYARALAWNGPDESFADRRAHAQELQIDFGAYVKFDFCSPPAAQLARLSRILEPRADLLPVAIEVVDPRTAHHQRQSECFEKLGLNEAKDAILDLATMVRARYGKTPVVYGNRANLSTFVDERADTFMVWLASFGEAGIKLAGRNPWTLWQYTGTLNVAGIGPKTTGDVFFGTEGQYEVFKGGDGNVALRAVN